MKQKSLSIRALALTVVAGVLLATTGCAEVEERAEAPGVDWEQKILYVGALNDESGPAAPMGRPFALGLRTLVHQINAGESDLLPEGWRVRLVERDHGYNPDRAVAAFHETHEQVLFYLQIFGTPNVLAVRPLLEEHNIVAFPASGSSLMAEHEYTPPAGASYRVEAMRAMDFIVDEFGATEDLRVAVVYQQDDYGMDGYEGWLAAAQHYGIEIVTEQAYQPGQQDFTEVVAGLIEADADAVFLATLPTATATILGTALQEDYLPTWIGNAPAWSDRFFDRRALPAPLLEHTYFVASGPFWGEEIPFVEDFIEGFEAYTRGRVPPDTYVLAAYVAAQVPFAAFRQALENDDVSREGYLRALRGISDFDLDGALPEPLDYTRFPYMPAVQSRVLQADLDNRRFTVVSDYQAPRGLTNSPD